MILVIVRNTLSVGGFMVRIRSRGGRGTLGTVVSGRARIIQITGILLRERRSVMISAGNLITQARQQLLWGRVH